MIAPREGTVERWAWDYVTTTDLDAKLAPPPLPGAWETDAPSRRVVAPGRPRALTVSARAAKSPSAGALRSPARRAQLVHAFLHHELQAAELMAWALLAFPETPRAFRRGLLGVALDEVRHMGLYRDHLATLGFRYGDFDVRDWFWERVPQVPTATHFAAVMGMGLEGGNIDHTMRFAERFRAAGDAEGAALEERICEEEIPHVRFALHWFKEWTSTTDFAAWMAHLPSPLSPMVMRGTPLNVAGRRRAGFTESFTDELARWSPTAPGF